MLTPVSVPLRKRKWVDVNPGSYDHECYVISKAMTRLLRHDQNIPRETDGAVKYEDIVDDFNKKKKKEVSKAITRLLRHDQTVPRGIEGAIH